MTDAKPDDNNPMDPANLSPANRLKFAALALVVLPVVWVWSNVSAMSDKISRAVANLGPDGPDN